MEPTPGAPSADAASTGGDDRVKNLQAEMDRKLTNMNAELAKSHEKLLAQIQTLVTPKAPQAPADDSELEDLLYKNPKEYTKRIEERASQKAEARLSDTLSKRDQAQARANQVLLELSGEYPELTNNTDPLTKLAVSKYNGLSADERTHPLAYKTAVAEAALELGVRPKSKRAAGDDDSFSLPGSKTGGKEASRGRKSDTDKKVEELSALFSLDPAKVKARQDKRRTFNNWE